MKTNEWFVEQLRRLLDALESFQSTSLESRAVMLPEDSFRGLRRHRPSVLGKFVVDRTPVMLEQMELGSFAFAELVPDWHRSSCSRLFEAGCTLLLVLGCKLLLEQRCMLSLVEQCLAFGSLRMCKTVQWRHIHMLPLLPSIRRQLARMAACKPPEVAGSGIEFGRLSAGHTE